MSVHMGVVVGEPNTPTSMLGVLSRVVGERSGIVHKLLASSFGLHCAH